MSKRVDITIRDGRVARIEADGFAGHACADVVDGLSRVLGMTEYVENRKPEYDLREVTQECGDESL